MARTRSIYIAKKAGQRNPVGGHLRHRRTPHGTFRVAMSLVLLLGCSSLCAGAAGPGIGFKIGAQTLEDPVDLDTTTRARFEFELSSARFYDDHLDLAFSFGGSSLGKFSDDYVDVVDDVLIEESFTDRLFLLDVRLAARLYPLGDASDIRPYVGAGLGYFWFLDHYEDEYAETYEEPPFSGNFYTFVDDDEGTDTVAHGLFPFVVAGLTLPLGSNGELMFEFQYDFEKEDAGIDLGGPIYMLGARFRF